MSTTPTPENLRRQAHFVAMGDEEGAACLLAAADRIEALERIVRANPYGLSEADAELLRSIIEAQP